MEYTGNTSRYVLRPTTYYCGSRNMSYVLTTTHYTHQVCLELHLAGVRLWMKREVVACVQQYYAFTEILPSIHNKYNLFLAWTVFTDSLQHLTVRQSPWWIASSGHTFLNLLKYIFMPFSSLLGLSLIKNSCTVTSMTLGIIIFTIAWMEAGDLICCNISSLHLWRSSRVRFKINPIWTCNRIM